MESGVDEVAACSDVVGEVECCFEGLTDCGWEPEIGDLDGLWSLAYSSRQNDFTRDRRESES